MRHHGSRVGGNSEEILMMQIVGSSGVSGRRGRDRHSLPRCCWLLDDARDSRDMTSVRGYVTGGAKWASEDVRALGRMVATDPQYAADGPISP
jgi:hypothetical protein